MILYFTGTGNSAFAAAVAADVLDDIAVDISKVVGTGQKARLESEKPWVICCPTYCWQIPTVLRDWISASEFNGSKDFYFIMTCGGDIGNAEKYLADLCGKKQFRYRGCVPVKMPENYIAMFDTPSEERATEIIEAAKPVIRRAAQTIRRGVNLPKVPVNAVGKVYSSAVNLAFYPLAVKDKKFAAGDKCVSCGKCAEICPMNNITLENGRPKWNGKCTHCMACISKCPAEAIEYGKVSRGKRRYVCPEYKK